MFKATGCFISVIVTSDVLIQGDDNDDGRDRKSGLRWPLIIKLILKKKKKKKRPTAT